MHTVVEINIFEVTTTVDYFPVDCTLIKGITVKQISVLTLLVTVCIN